VSSENECSVTAPQWLTAASEGPQGTGELGASEPQSEAEREVGDFTMWPD
jgi:hypothetical protein